MIKNSIFLIIIIIALQGCPQTPQQPQQSVSDSIQTAEAKEVIQDTLVVEIPKLDSTRLTYTWLSNYDIENTMVNRIKVPAGYYRTKVDSSSFKNWLRHLPLKPGLPNIKLYNKEDKWSQDIHVGVVDMDVDEVDLQQCADAVMRLKAEYHFQRKEYDQIHFNYMCGDAVNFKNWVAGKKPVPYNHSVIWKPCSNCNSSYKSFRKYLFQIYNYAGTISLQNELVVKEWKDIEIGDVVIQGGSPGHAIAVVDVATNPETGDRIFLLAQSYMPAQESHVLKNPNNEVLSPWYSVSDNMPQSFFTPEWTFPQPALRGYPSSND
ncbi:MAG: hypothetical protein JKY54_03865 [Flavobacteriales bacterium]|nr:hypothetical protein [Flavobacteriales bacterium]